MSLFHSYIICFPKLKEMYFDPTTHITLAKLKSDAEKTIADLKSEVYDLEQIVKEGTGFWYVDPELCNCNRKRFCGLF